MELEVARKLIEKGVTNTDTPQQWADLGAGEGLFTRALASLVDAGSTIYAVDTDINALKKIKLDSQDVKLKTFQKDFVTEDMIVELDGILMANSFHFILNKLAFLGRIVKNLKPSGNLIMVEYDTDSANPWIPYPVSFDALQKIVQQSNFFSVTKMAEVPSKFNRANIYSAVLKRIN